MMSILDGTRNSGSWAGALGAALAVALWLVTGSAAMAGPALPTGEKRIWLVSTAGETLRIGRITFAADGDARQVAVTLDAPELKDEFLSMRPFRCVPGAKETWCHLAYPYDLKGRITADDLTDLEYSLLFLFKPPTGYGIDAWNGLYFKTRRRRRRSAPRHAARSRPRGAGRAAREPSGAFDLSGRPNQGRCRRPPLRDDRNSLAYLMRAASDCATAYPLP